MLPFVLRFCAPPTLMTTLFNWRDRALTVISALTCMKHRLKKHCRYFIYKPNDRALTLLRLEENPHFEMSCVCTPYLPGFAYIQKVLRLPPIRRCFLRLAHPQIHKDAIKFFSLKIYSLRIFWNVPSCHECSSSPPVTVLLLFTKICLPYCP